MNIFGASDKGLVRENNEDSFFYRKFQDGSILLIICDGMGGENAGEVASGIVIEEVTKNSEKKLATAKDVKDARSVMRSLIRSANTKIYKMAGKKTDCKGMGTTAVAAFVKDDKMLFMNIGDSRAYLLHQGKLYQVTRDHSLVEEMVRSGALTKDESKTYPGRNMITMAIGTEQNVLPDFFEHRLVEGDRVMLCSDGLSNMVEDEEIQAAMAESVDSEHCVKTLIEQANRNGGKDNVTVIVFQY